MLCLCRKNKKAIAGSNTEGILSINLGSDQPFANKIPCLASDGAKTSTVALATASAEVGTVTLIAGTFSVTVTVQTTGGYYFNKLYLWYGESLDELPKTDCGWPKTSEFPIAETYENRQMKTSYEIKLMESGYLCPTKADTNIFYVLKAVVSIDGPRGPQPEAAWAQGTAIQDNCGGKCGPSSHYSSFLLQCCTPPPPCQPSGSQKAFAKSTDVGLAKCFNVLSNISIDTWGWSNGKYPVGSSGMWPIWSNATGCATLNGYLVGSFNWSYDTDGNFTGTFDARPDCDQPVYFANTHLHVSFQYQLPLFQGKLSADVNNFANKHENLGAPGIGVLHDTFNVRVPSKKDIYIVAHATAVVA